MTRFRLTLKDPAGNRTGPHVFHLGGRGGNMRRRKIHAGQIVESDEPLDQLFRGKFIRLSDPAPQQDDTALAEPKAKKRKKV
ncbi:MAG: hypothetical protein JW993_18335 [Sedimentisphaerales bacterium]|nr:hypothetical protein [Sedimentisphaerales bacterium]